MRKKDNLEEIRAVMKRSKTGKTTEMDFNKCFEGLGMEG